MEYEALLFDLFGTLVDGHAQAMPGARALLERIAAGRWAVVTSCHDALARSLLSEAALAVPEVLVTSDLVSANKPSPEGYLLAASRLGRDPSSCIVFEDSVEGVKAALAAGMDVVAISQNRDPALMRLATASVVRIADVRVGNLEDGRYRIDW
jgi:beta-phosphoglucomutase-like phosphatase (HAD superfamily)